MKIYEQLKYCLNRYRSYVDGKIPTIRPIRLFCQNKNDKNASRGFADKAKTAPQSKRLCSSSVRSGTNLSIKVALLIISCMAELYGVCQALIYSESAARVAVHKTVTRD